MKDQVSNGIPTSFVLGDTQTRWTVFVGVDSTILATVARCLMSAGEAALLNPAHFGAKRKRKSRKFDKSTFPLLSQRHSPRIVTRSLTQEGRLVARLNIRHRG